MSSVVLALPHIDEANLVFDESETREILAFFWPHSLAAITGLTITTELRRYAQGLLIVAVDASYAMGFLDILVNVLTKRKPGTSIKNLVKKLVKKNVKHWWKHASDNDLRDAKVYETVRGAIALKQKGVFEMYVNGIAMSSSPRRHAIALHLSSRSIAWV